MGKKKSKDKKNKKKQSTRQKMKKALLKRTKEGSQRRGKSFLSLFKPDLEGVRFWRPKEGDHIIDIIPYEAGDMDPITKEGEVTYSLEFYIHRKVGPNEDQVVLCLAETFAEKCPVCEHRKQLQKEGADEDIWKPLFAKQRNLYNIVCLDSSKDEEKGVQVWEVAWFYMEKHLAKLAKGPMRRRKRGRSDIEPNIAFADPDEGRSVCFTIETEGRDYPEFSGHQFDERDYAIEDEILDEAQCLDELLKIPTYEEVEAIYYGEVDDEESDDEDDSDDDEEEVDDDDDDEEEDTDTDDDDQEEEEKKEKNRSTKKRGRKTSSKKSSKKKSKKGKCPAGGEFGADVNEFGEECDDCDYWEDCVEANQDLDDDDDDDDQEEEKKSKKKKKSRRNRK